MSYKQITLLPNIIICGVAKAATTSLFNYLSDHPDVCGSKVKETRFLTTFNSKSFPDDCKKYSEFFSHCRYQTPHLIEASPGYYLHPEIVAPNINYLVPNANLIFLLRDPVQRLFSYYLYQKTRGSIPDNLFFDDYINACVRYSNGIPTRRDRRLLKDHNHLIQLEGGCYVEYILQFNKWIDWNRIHIIFFEDLMADPKNTLLELSNNIGLSSEFFNNYDFKIRNKTVDPRNKLLHRFAMRTNKFIEPSKRRLPSLFNTTSNIYFKLNHKNAEKKGIPEQSEIRLKEYYSSSNAALFQMLNYTGSATWLSDHCPNNSC